jgi:hypothetical protein
MTHIDVDTAYEIIFDDPIAYQEVSQHRWYTKYLVVFENADGHLMGFYHLKPATEMQEGQDEFEDDPVPVFHVFGRDILTTVYEREA